MQKYFFKPNFVSDFFNLKLEIAINNNKLKYIKFKNGNLPKIKIHEKKKNPKSSTLVYVIKMLEEYFKSGFINHEEIWSVLEFSKSFPREFTRNVMKKTIKIPSGEVQTYGSIAKIMNSHAYQAIGNSLRNNPFPIFIPCHRVVAKGNIGGFMGNKYEKNTDSNNWTLKLKEKLLKFEHNLN